MRAMFVLPGAVLAMALFAAGTSVASAASAEADKCTVSVDRTGGADTFDVVKQKLDTGCLCYVTTGPGTESGAVEKKIGYVQSTGKCGPHDKWPVWLLGVGAGVGGIIAASSAGGRDGTSGGNDSTGG